MANTGNAEIHTSTIVTEGSFGEVKIADEVVAIIAGLAASDVEGLASLSGGLTRDKIEKVSMRSLGKGVRVQVQDGEVKVAMNVNVCYGYSVPDVSAEVQDKVKTAIETMTGLEVTGVNIKVVSVAMENAE